MKIQILCDSPSSWMIPYAKVLEEKVRLKGHDVVLIYDQDDVEEGDILFLLSCEQIFRKLPLNKHNLVAHSSDLPKGKGWSPLTWQIIEGKMKIPVTLFEAIASVDAGPIYKQENIVLDGTELIEELRLKQANVIEKLILSFLHEYPNNVAVEQEGESTFYPKRNKIDSQLDPERSIAEQFNLLRVVDNERYPAYFDYKGCRYIIKIEKEGKFC